MNKILVVAAHPDDEVLGVGATIAQHVANGDTAVALILGEGQTSRWSNRNLADESVVNELHNDTLAAAKVIGYEKVIFQNFPDNRFDQVDLLDVVKAVEKVIDEIKPDVVYTHHYEDLNIDHKITAEAVLTATRPLKNCTVKELYYFETLSSSEWNFKTSYTGFRPNVFIDVTDYLNGKLEAMKEYKTELCEFPHPRSLEVLIISAKKWGSVVGKEYVEAFELARKIVGGGQNAAN